MTKSHPTFHHRFGFIFGALATAILLASPSAQARTYDTTVTIYDYYGLQGVDSRGNKLYGAKIMQGGNFYHVEMLTPMPCLANRKYEQAKVTVTENSNSCMNVIYNGQRARVHRLTRLDTRKPAYSDFYHDTAAHDYNHGNRSKKQAPKRWLPLNFFK